MHKDRKEIEKGVIWLDVPGSRRDSRIWPAPSSPAPPRTGSSRRPAPASAAGWGRRLSGFVLVCGREEGIPVDEDLGQKSISSEKKYFPVKSCGKRMMVAWRCRISLSWLILNVNNTALTKTGDNFVKKRGEFWHPRNYKLCCKLVPWPG